MIKIIGVRFRNTTKIYYFDPLSLTIEKNDHVIVETKLGVEYGKVVLGPKYVTDDKVVQPLKPVIRLATEKDDETNEKNQQLEKEAFTICLDKIQKHNLAMKLIDSEYTFDRNKLLFYFTADGRIDFRELVKDLAAVFRTRIELRQIGVRDETKLIGGIGICGRPLCCHTYLSEFAPVSIKMAKEQNLSLNPSKISGVCGRLMCCLKNEQEAYEYLNSTLPNIGDHVKTTDGLSGEVKQVNVLKQLAKIIVEVNPDEKEEKEYSVKDLIFNKKKNYNPSGTPQLDDIPISEDDLKTLEAMEKKDLDDLSDDNTEQSHKKKKHYRSNEHYERRNNGSNKPDANGHHKQAETISKKPFKYHKNANFNSGTKHERTKNKSYEKRN